MSFTFETTNKINNVNLTRIAEITALGFGRKNDAQNDDDTARHCQSADHIQQAFHHDQLVGFALYRRCLWRHSN